jgi:hypothetical protein
MKVNLTGRILAIAITILSLVNNSPSLAESIFYNAAFNVTAAPLGIEQMGINRFDSTLGDLDKVYVTIQGTMNLNVINTPFNDGVNPIPYDYTIAVYQLFYGVPSSIFFTFQDPGGTFIINGNSQGNQDSFNFATSFSYDFEFNNLTDLFGGTIPNTSNVIPPTIVNGLLENFIEDFLPFNEIDLRQLVEYLEGSGPIPSTITSQASGTLMITYEYTPVPLPGTFVLLGSGLLGLVGWRRFRKS